MNESRQPDTGVDRIDNGEHSRQPLAWTERTIRSWLAETGQQTWRWAQLLLQATCPARWPGLSAWLQRLALSLLALPLLILIQMCNAVGLLLDDWLFRGYRQVVPVRPVFILGVPRSGTTHTHHLLSCDPRFTTVSLWEALFAPSITQRHVVFALLRLDQRCGGFVALAVRWLEKRLQGAMDDVHPTGLASPEEDFLLLMPWLDCFLLVLAYPQCQWLWALARGDEPAHRTRSEQVLQRYRRLLQRHLFFHGPDRQLLSKNASFAGIARTLAATFPDARIVVCERDASMAARSQLRSLAGVRQLWQIDRVCGDFDERLMALLEYYYRNLDALHAELPRHRCARLPLWQLSREPRQAMNRLYAQLGLGVPGALETRLCELEARAPTRPGTRLVTNGAATDDRFDRFRPWCHVPGNRL